MRIRATQWRLMDFISRFVVGRAEHHVDRRQRARRSRPSRTGRVVHLKGDFRCRWLPLLPLAVFDSALALLVNIPDERTRIGKTILRINSNQHSTRPRGPAKRAPTRLWPRERTREGKTFTFRLCPDSTRPQPPGGGGGGSKVVRGREPRHASATVRFWFPSLSGERVRARPSLSAPWGPCDAPPARGVSAVTLMPVAPPRRRAGPGGSRPWLAS
jgi:hypothetical protein